MTKREARAWAKARRTELDMAAVGRGMAQALFSLPQWQSAGAVLAFAAMPDEPDTAEILRRALADGKRLLLIHGDIFDQVTRHHRWVAVLGDVAYNQLVRLNLWLSWVRRKLGCSGYWSLAGYAKRRIKTALNFIFDFEASAVHQARERGLDGVICGHIHWATIREIDGLQYVNCGDWVDSCTAIVEHFDGRLELIHWGTRQVSAPATGASLEAISGTAEV